MKKVLLILSVVALSACAQKNIELEGGVTYSYVTKGKGQTVDSLSRVSTNINLIVNEDTVWSTYGGETFDFVFKGRQPMVDGFDAVMRELKAGDRVIAIIPPEMGYKDRANGPIPANSTLTFDIDVLSVQ